MAIVKRGSRKIVVDGIEYRWRVRQKPTYNQAGDWSGLACSVEQAVENPGATLVINLSRAHPNNWMGEATTPITPAEVADYIRSALAKGWHPLEPGKRFWLPVSE